MTSTSRCDRCGTPTPPDVLARARRHAFWQKPDGACPACAQQELLITLLERGEAVFAESVQRTWPLDPETVGPLPTPLRLRADPRFTGRGGTIAIADSGFVAHPDLTEPVNRIRLWVDATSDPVRSIAFQPDQRPVWPGSDEARDHQWHGTMTSVVAAGNGYLSRGLYPGLAPEADVVLIHLTDQRGKITDQALLRAVTWLERHAAANDVRVVSLSVAGDDAPMGLGAIDRAVERLVAAGLTVVAAAGNDGIRRLVPPATSPSALTVGGLDDRGSIERGANDLWHGNYGESASGTPKPELVAPSLWVVAPILPGSAASRRAGELFDRRARGDDSGLDEILERKFVTDHYQHVDGTSFAAPIAASTAAVMLEANPSLTPRLIRELLIRSAHPVPGADPARQGAGALDAGRAVSLALLEAHRWSGPTPVTPVRTSHGVVFRLHDHGAAGVSVFGSWDGWRDPVPAERAEAGIWETDPFPLRAGEFGYKFLLDGVTWIPDPTNPLRGADGRGGINSRFRWPD